MKTVPEKLRFLIGLLRQKDGGLMGDLTVIEHGYLLRMWRGQNGDAVQIDKLISFSLLEGANEAGLKLIVESMRASFEDEDQEVLDFGNAPTSEEEH